VLPDVLQHEGGFANASWPLDAYATGLPLNLLRQTADKRKSCGLNQSPVAIDQYVHYVPFKVQK
jgi:hypothetical protein